jgi:hypothetical protein
MIRRFWIPATALCLAFVMAVIGSISRDAMAAIIASMPAQGMPTVQGDGPPKILPAAGEEPDTQRNLSGRYWTRGIVLLIIIVLLIWLIYRSFTGWRPMISWLVGEPIPPRGR